MEEVLTIFDADMKPVGEKARNKVHEEGDWHETFHGWGYKVEGEKSYLYFQKRSDDKKDFPSMFDITAAGHIEADEHVLDGGLREVNEELGLIVLEHELVYQGFIKEELTAPGLLDREICHVFLFEVIDEQAFRPGDEVQDVVKVDAEHLLAYLSKKESMVTAYSIMTERSYQLNQKNICPHHPDYLPFIVQALLEYVARM
ncbi:NUDIX domain-containing protein [Thalassobacillus sp. CUG 92003]|uniref:NUDIX hydrolase n=1 Tax=Thalassobacillus sp. CUG 92003 TaxID=2736641 RepID=UPI0015E71235|nr:NUDIX domain-containing protein [Thalassobacillus sp. CUG 92003]